MTSESVFLGVSERRANHDTVDGETLVLDPTTGVLTMLGGIGPCIWERLVAGVDRSTLLDELDGIYGDAAAADAAWFLDELVASGLVEEIEPVASATTPALGAWPTQYEPPHTERYEEIADIMTMDPIHEVDPSLGWPHASEPHPPMG